jgi:hypothetical protein
MQSLLRSLCVSAFTLVSCPVFASDEFAAKVCEAEMRSIQGALQALELDFRDVAVSLGVQEDVFSANQILRKLSEELCPTYKVVERVSSPRKVAKVPLPNTIIRPKLRPSNFQPTPPKETAETSLEDILREVTQSSPSEAVILNERPQLIGDEMEPFPYQVAPCWSVNVGSRAANVAVTIGMELLPDGKVVASSLELVDFEGGNQSDANVAFQAGRRAILRCQKDGYDLPEDEYHLWRNLEIKFDPSEMRKR